MTRNKKLVLLAEIIEQARQARGQDAVPEGVTPEMSSHVIRLIQNQRRDLNQSGHKIGLRGLTKLVCEAQVFSNDAEENWFLQYAYQIVAMYYFGLVRKEHAKQNKYLTQSRDALVAQENARLNGSS